MSDPRPRRAVIRTVAEKRTISRRGRYFTLEQATEAYPAFSMRLLRRLVQERRIPFSRAGRRIVLAESDIERYLEANRGRTAVTLPGRGVT